MKRVEGRRSSMALACAVVPSGWNERIGLFFLHWTAAQAKAVLLRLILRLLFCSFCNKKGDSQESPFYLS